MARVIHRTSQIRAAINSGKIPKLGTFKRRKKKNAKPAKPKRKTPEQESYDNFFRRLKLFGYPTYEDYLTSQAWRNMQGWYHQSLLPRICLACHSPNIQLHHWRYENVCDENPAELIPLCEAHHKEAHRFIEATKTPLCNVPATLQHLGLSRDQARERFHQFAKFLANPKSRFKHRIHVCHHCGRQLLSKTIIRSNRPKCFQCYKAHQKELAHNNTPKEN
jgi:hypothetical protein